MNSQAEQKRECVGREHDQVHAREKQRIERQDAFRLALAATVAEGEQARRAGAEVHDNQKGGGQRVNPEMRADARQSERQHQLGRGPARGCQHITGEDAEQGREPPGRPIDRQRPVLMARGGQSGDAEGKKSGDARQKQRRHG